MRLRNRHSQISVLPDAQPPRPRLLMRLSALLYYVAILGLFSYIAYYLFATYFMIETRGRMFLPKYQIFAPAPGIVTGVFARDGDTVIEGQSLAHIAIEAKAPQNNAQEIAKVKRDLQQSRDMVALLQTRIKQKLGELGRSNSRLALDSALELRLGTENPNYALTKEIDAARFELAKAEVDLRSLENYLDQIQGLESAQPTMPPIIVPAPFAGAVTAVYKREHAYLGREEPFCSIVKKGESGRIVAYFKPEDGASLSAGKPATILLPDKTKLSAKLKAFNSSSLEVDRTIRERYVPVSASLAAELAMDEPISPETWRLYDEADVSVRMRR